jgi:hypothetical protein
MIGMVYSWGDAPDYTISDLQPMFFHSNNLLIIYGVLIDIIFCVPCATIAIINTEILLAIELVVVPFGQQPHPIIADLVFFVVKKIFCYGWCLARQKFSCINKS